MQAIQPANITASGYNAVPCRWPSGSGRACVKGIADWRRACVVAGSGWQKETSRRRASVAILAFIALLTGLYERLFHPALKRHPAMRDLLAKMMMSA
jgi:hypothetical protein